MAANDTQISGQHYIKYGELQPWDMFMRWNLNPYASHILPYIVRYRDKGGIEDLKKARHYLDKWIEEEERLIPTLTEKVNEERLSGVATGMHATVYRSG